MAIQSRASHRLKGKARPCSYLLPAVLSFNHVIHKICWPSQYGARFPTYQESIPAEPKHRNIDHIPSLTSRVFGCKYAMDRYPQPVGKSRCSSCVGIVSNSLLWPGTRIKAHGNISLFAEEATICSSNSDEASCHQKPSLNIKRIFEPISHKGSHRSGSSTHASHSIDVNHSSLIAEHGSRSKGKMIWHNSRS